jgi:glycosyltransferase involved in cell wall biosynthesis
MWKPLAQAGGFFIRYDNPMKTPAIALVMIVRNGAATLARCLSSVRDHVDEIIVLDTGSTDESVAVARHFGVRVHHFE